MWSFETSRKSELIGDLINATHSCDADLIEYVICKYRSGKLEIICDKANNVTRISFMGIWDRSPLCIYASFVDISNHQWLLIYNERFVLPKEYYICCGD